MSAEFRPLTADSIDALLDAMSRLYEHEGLPFDRPVARRAVEELLAHPELGGVWLIEVGGTTAGYVVLTIGYSLEFHGRDGLIDELYLDPEWRGRGLGTEALAFVEAECRRRGISALHLEVGHDNPRALALYKRSGFEPHQRYFMTKWI